MRRSVINGDRIRGTLGRKGSADRKRGTANPRYEKRRPLQAAINLKAIHQPRVTATPSAREVWWGCICAGLPHRATSCRTALRVTVVRRTGCRLL